ncbi:hypothetical protein ACFLTN_00955 [Chloroflexota bacterium]
MNTEKKASKKKIIQAVFLAAIVCIAGLVLYFQGYHDAIGEYPLSFKKTILPPDVSPVNQSFEQVMEFIKSDNTDKLEYKEGFNCVDFVFMVVRYAHWNGIIAEPIGITFEDSSKHMILMIPTNDRGTIFIEAMTDNQVEPKIGSMYMGKLVKELYGLGTVWVPLDEYRQKIGW